MVAGYFPRRAGEEGGIGWLANLCAAFAVALALAAAPAPAPAQGIQPEPFTGRTLKEPAFGAEHMVAAAHPLAVEAGHEMLERGGSAADAAIAIQLVLTVVEPQSSGIGGGGLALYWDDEARTLAAWDGRETAPADTGPDLFLHFDGSPMGFWEAVIGGRSVGVPGMMRLLEALHREHGRLPWAELFEPAIRLAEEGFAVTHRLAFTIEWAQGLRLFPEARAQYFDPAGRPPRPGARLAKPELAETLHILAREGADAFYEGPIAEAIVRAVRKAPVNPGKLSLDDLAAYRVERREPICVAYRGHDVCGFGPPSSGGIAIGQILGMLERFDMRRTGFSSPGVHRIIEASKLAFADRNRYVADPGFMDVPVTGLLDRDYLALRSAMIRPARAMRTPVPYGRPTGAEELEWAPSEEDTSSGTTHFVVRDGRGDAISMTTTIESGFGSRLMAAGFLLNNQLTDFDFVPMRSGRWTANRVEPGKRPRSSMTPTVVFRDGEPRYLIGSPGGARIIGYVAQRLVALIDWEMEPQRALDMGNFVNLNGPTDLERFSDVARFKLALEAMGHTVRLRLLNSGVHAIRIGPDGLVGAADPRREGIAMGR